LSLGLGLAMGAIFSVFTRGGEPPELARELIVPSAWQGFLVSIGAGIREEIWFRLGFMTFLVWIGTLVTRAAHPDVLMHRPPQSVQTIANLLAALLFAAMHLPQAQALLGLSGPIILFVLVGNGLPALVFGWLYWHRGLLSAMLAHFSFDLVLKVVLPLLP
jgi:membrane protease YdiL (CAAX protease family)